MRLPRCRTVMKWVGAGLCAAIFVAWFAGRWFDAAVTHVAGTRYQSAMLGYGGLTVGGGLNTAPTGFDPPEGWSTYLYRRSADSFGWSWAPSWLTFSHSREREDILYFPLYIPFVLLALPTAFLFHRDRRRVRWSREGRCVGCGYDLSGVRGKCPECGREAA